MLKMIGIELELTDDIDMHLFIEKGMRGGISYIAERYSKANNKYMKDYDSTKETISIMNFDANNLYGWAMIQYLPYGSSKWTSNKEINNLSSTEKNSPNRYILEVDLENPSELHDLHNDYPLAPEKPRVSNNMLSKYSANIANKY